MAFYPVFLDLRERCCLVVGGGLVAEEKVRGLLAAGARVRLVARTKDSKDSKDAKDKNLSLESLGSLESLARGFLPENLDGVALAIVCSQPPEVVEAVWVEARRRGVLVNTVDDVAHCDFIAPSVVRRGDLAIAISTGGRAPALAVRLRERLEREIGDEHARFLELAGSARTAVAARWPDFEARRERWYELVDSEVLELLREGDEEGATRRFLEILDVEALTPGPSPSSPHSPAGRGETSIGHSPASSCPPSPGEGRGELGEGRG